MKKSMLTGAALLLGTAIVAPTVISAAADQPQQAQSGMDAMDGQMGEHGMMGHGGMTGPQMGMHGQGFMARMMHRMMGMPPRQRCEERLARRAGVVAYVVTKLNLTNEQKPLWEKLRPILLANADRERDLCATAKPRGEETVLDRVNRREQVLSAQLQGVQQAKPGIEQLYNSLTPEQKAIADHPFRH